MHMRTATSRLLSHMQALRRRSRSWVEQAPLTLSERALAARRRANTFFPMLNRVGTAPSSSLTGQAPNSSQ